MGLGKEPQLPGPSSSSPAEIIMITITTPPPCIYTEHCTFQRACSSQWTTHNIFQRMRTEQYAGGTIFDWGRQGWVAVLVPWAFSLLVSHLSWGREIYSVDHLIYSQVWSCDYTTALYSLAQGGRRGWGGNCPPALNTSESVEFSKSPYTLKQAISSLSR